jgi:hypothetical protein
VARYAPAMPRQPRLLTLFVLACALFLRVWVPAGWMPAASGGAFAIAPCAAAAPMVMASGESAHHDPSHKAQHDGDCSFAPHHAGAAQTASLAPVVAPLLAAAPLPEHFAAPALATGPPALPPPATGPPALA